MLQSTALLEFYLVKNIASTNEIISQLDEILKGSDIVPDLVDEKVESNEKKDFPEQVTSVSELFGESDSQTANADTDNTLDDIFSEAPFSGLLTSLPWDIVIEENEKFLKPKVLSLATKNQRGEIIANIVRAALVHELSVHSNYQIINTKINEVEILQNKVDLVKATQAQEQQKQIKELEQGLRLGKNFSLLGKGSNNG